MCKSIEASLGGIFKPADWKFQKKATQWHHLEALIDFDLLFPIPDDTHPQTLKRLLKVSDSCKFNNLCMLCV